MWLTQYSPFVLICIGINLHLTEGQSEVLSRCCEAGREQWTKRAECSERLDSSPHGITTDQLSVCLSTMQICCAHLLRERECKEGEQVARTGGICEESQTGNKQHCCEACNLGLKTGSMGLGCQLHGVSFGPTGESAYRHCCEETTKRSQSYILKNHTEQENMCLMLPDELCAHICVPSGSSYKCACRPGYTLMSDGKSCSLRNRKCQECSQSCEETAREVVCSCHLGYRLHSDNRTCILVERTSVKACPAGYKHNDLTAGCQDVDECVEQEDSPCDSYQVCENTIGSFSCVCKKGFKKDPLTHACIDVNECQTSLHNCIQYQRCDNTIGSFVCVRDVNCGTGYTLNSNSGKCEDDDECALGTDTCRFLGPDWECKNTQGSFRCVRKSLICSDNQCEQEIHKPALPSCPRGYTYSTSGCIDINECETNTAKCSPNQRCVNIQGNYLCSDVLSCKPGFKLNPSKTQCTDINECIEQPGLCSHYCQNRWGSYKCSCRTGFSLNEDNRTCSDLNECEEEHRCQGYCINHQGTYSCQCPPGYQLSFNNHSCDDIDECNSPESICLSEDEICVNVAGSHRCNAIVCPPGYKRDKHHSNRCSREDSNCYADDLECRKQPATYSFHYITMVSNYTIPKSGNIKLFYIESSWRSTAPQFTLDLIEARVPPGVQAATRSDFDLKKQYGKATVELKKTLFGPQEIHLELKTEVFNSNMLLGTTISNVEIIVSQYTF